MKHTYLPVEWTVSFDLHCQILPSCSYACGLGSASVTASPGENERLPCHRWCLLSRASLRGQRPRREDDGRPSIVLKMVLDRYTKFFCSLNSVCSSHLSLVQLLFDCAIQARVSLSYHSTWWPLHLIHSPSQSYNPNQHVHYSTDSFSNEITLSLLQASQNICIELCELLLPLVIGTVAFLLHNGTYESQFLSLHMVPPLHLTVTVCRRLQSKNAERKGHNTPFIGRNTRWNFWGMLK